MKYIKKNKFTIFAIIIFILLVIAGAKIKNILVPDEGKAVYGNRLEQIEKHSIKKEIFTKIEDALKENSRVLSVNHNIHGKIINFIITVADEVSIDDAKTIANGIVPFFENKELEYYTLNVYVAKNNKELNNFPIEGYKDPESESLIFTKDREISVKGETNE